MTTLNSVPGYTLLYRCFTPTICPIHRRYLSRNVAPRKTNIDHCMELVKKCDYESFLCTLLLPAVARCSVFAIRAFNVEIAQIRDVISDRNNGLNRIQFWKYTIQEIFKDSPPHSPIAFELARAVKKHRLSKQWFLRLLDARKENLFDRPHADLDAVKKYSEDSISSLHYLTLECLGVRDVHADHAASHLGKALGIVTMLRSVRHLAAHRNHVSLPTQLMIQHEVSQEEVIRGCEDQKMKNLIYDIASSAHNELSMARSLKKDVPLTAMPSFLSTVICDAFLQKVQKVDFNIFDNRLHQRNHWLALSLIAQKWKGTY